MTTIDTLQNLPNRIDFMREARHIPQVILQKYNEFRSKYPGRTICAFEGYDDVTFYDTIIHRVKEDASYIPFVCLGKDKTLTLRDCLERNKSPASDLVRYFIDNDFDGLKGREPGSDLYCTETYSIENILSTPHVLERILISEYRCNDLNGIKDVENIKNIYNDRFKEYKTCMRYTNFCIFICRKMNIKMDNINNNLEQYISVNLNLVKLKVDNDKILKLIGLDNKSQIIAPKDIEKEFDEMDPLNCWRGKFLFGFFKKFLSCLKEDRGAKTPECFVAKSTMTFDPKGDIIRTLASLIEIPHSMREFIVALPN